MYAAWTEPRKWRVGHKREGHLHKDSFPTPTPRLSYHTAKISSGVGELWDALFIQPMDKILISYLLGSPPQLDSKQQVRRGKMGC